MSMARWRWPASFIHNSLRLHFSLIGLRIELDMLLPPSRCSRRFVLQLWVGRLWLYLVGHSAVVAESVLTPRQLRGTVRCFQ